MVSGLSYQIRVPVKFCRYQLWLGATCWKNLGALEFSSRTSIAAWFAYSVMAWSSWAMFSLSGPPIILKFFCAASHHPTFNTSLASRTNGEFAIWVTVCSALS